MIAVLSESEVRNIFKAYPTFLARVFDPIPPPYFIDNYIMGNRRVRLNELKLPDRRLFSIDIKGNHHILVIELIVLISPILLRVH